jgi:hypothetical protein
VEEHVFVLTLEASGEVTPAQPQDAAAEPDIDVTVPEPEEAEQ